MKLKATFFVLLSAFFLTLPLRADSITTTFADNNRFDGNMFDVSIGSNSLDITGLDVNVDTGSMTIDVYIKDGTYVGSETNSAAWTLVSATAVTGLGAGSMTDVAITPFILDASTLYGMYVTIDTNVDAAPFMYYTNGSNTYSNSDLSLTAGNGEGGKFGSLAVTSGRTWDGTIDYSVIPATTTATPEPGTLLLSASGLSSVLFAFRKGRQRA